MKVLIIPDIHHRTALVDQVLAKYESCVDLTIFLGDIFDDFGDGGSVAERTARWLKDSLHRPNRIHLRGNHDQSYQYWKLDWMLCSGYNSTKCNRINHVMKREDWMLMKWYHIIGDTIFSHGGIAPSYFGYECTIQYFEKKMADAIVYLHSGIYSSMFYPGQARGGHERFGGITWLDFDIEFQPTPGINQVMGHSPHIYPEFKCAQESINLALDTHSHHIAIWDSETKEFEIIQVLEYTPSELMPAAPIIKKPYQ